MGNERNNVPRHAIGNFMTRYGTSREETAWFLDMEDDLELFDAVAAGRLRVLPADRLAKFVRIGVEPGTLFPEADEDGLCVAKYFGYFPGTAEEFCERVIQKAGKNGLALGTTCNCGTGLTRSGLTMEMLFRPEIILSALEGGEVPEAVVQAAMLASASYVPRDAGLRTG